jgi:hypothetical protein
MFDVSIGILLQEAKQPATWAWAGGGAFFWAKGGAQRVKFFFYYKVFLILGWVPGHPVVSTRLRPCVYRAVR